MADEDAAKMKFDADLAAEADKMGAYKLHPVVTKIHQRFGGFNLIRNARDQKQVDIEKIDDQVDNPGQG